MHKREWFLMAPEGDAPAGGALAAPAGGAPAAATPPAGGGESLLQQPPSGSPATPPAAVTPPAATTDQLPAWLGKVPEKFHVKAADGKYDVEATLAKQAESYTHLERQRGPQAPATPIDYKFTPPEALKDIKLDDALSAAFREKAHKLGFTQEQYQLALEEHVSVLPGLLDSVAKLSKQECTEALRQVWKSDADFNAGLADAQRAVNGAPEGLRQDIWERFGRDPAFVQFAASVGKEMREDRSPNPPSASAAAADQSQVATIMASEAYRNPKHADHARVSAQVQAFFQRTGSSAPAT